MEVRKLKDNGLEQSFKVLIPSEQIKGTVDKEIDKKIVTVALPGFRSGKQGNNSTGSYAAKRKIVETRYANSIKIDVIEKETQDIISKIIKENNFNLAVDPKIENFQEEDNGNISFEVELELIPEFDMPDFSKIQIEKITAKIDQKDTLVFVEKVIKNSNKNYKIKDGVSEEFDKVIIDFQGFIDNKEFDNGSAKDFELVLGSGVLIPGFEHQLISKKAGEDVEVNVNFPDDYHKKDLAGKPAVFKVTIKSVMSPEEVIMSEDFVKELGYDNIDALYESVTQSLETRSQKYTNTLLRLRLFNQLEDMLNFNVPSTILNKERELLKQQMGGEFSNTELSKEDFDKALDRMSLRRIRIGFLLAKYSREHKLEFTQDEVRDEVLKRAAENPKHSEEIIKFYTSNPQSIKSLIGTILENKAVDHILDSSIKFNEKTCTLDELEAIVAEESNNMKLLSSN